MDNYAASDSFATSLTIIAEGSNRTELVLACIEAIAHIISPEHQHFNIKGSISIESEGLSTKETLESFLQKIIADIFSNKRLIFSLESTQATAHKIVSKALYTHPFSVETEPKSICVSRITLNTDSKMISAEIVITL